MSTVRRTEGSYTESLGLQGLEFSKGRISGSVRLRGSRAQGLGFRVYSIVAGLGHCV